MQYISLQDIQSQGSYLWEMWTLPCRELHGSSVPKNANICSGFSQTYSGLLTEGIVLDSCYEIWEYICE